MPARAGEAAAAGEGVTRREFLAGTAAATFTVITPALARGTEANSTITLGMIGCGGRGTWIAKLFHEHGKFRVTACADYFQDRADAFGERYGIPRARRHVTLSGYQRLLEEEIDAVVIESPPGFHPEQAAAAVDAGKHVFLAKPVAVDVPGCRLIAESGGKASAKKLVFLVDFQTRASPLYQEAARRVQAGEIGRLICGEARYPWAGGGSPPPSSPEERLRRWYCFKAISGDFIVEQNIHTLDVATWFIGAAPERAFGTGGSKGLRSHGNIWDHFEVTYWFPEDFHLAFNSVQVVPGTPDSIPCRIYGAEGLVDTDYFSHVWIRGKHPYAGGKLTNLYTEGAVANIVEFQRAIETGRCDNATVPASVRSNLTCILGRTAAYGSRLVTWKEMMEGGETLELDRRGLKA